MTSTVIGLIVGVVCVLVGMLLAGPLSSFWDLTSIFIVLGGTFGALIMSFPFSQLKGTVKAVMIAFKKKDIDPADCIEQIITLANIARKEGLLALENMTENIQDPYLRKGIMLIVDGSNSELVKNMMETDTYYLQERHGRSIAVLSTGAGYAPSFGMIGTLIGLIVMLLNLEDSSTLGPSMAVALITTLYGCLLANLVFNPLSKKLAALSAQEVNYNEMVLEGILSIQDGENPRMIRDKLEAFISRQDLEALDARLEAAKSSSSSSSSDSANAE